MQINEGQSLILQGESSFGSVQETDGQIAKLSEIGGETAKTQSVASEAVPETALEAAPKTEASGTYSELNPLENREIRQSGQNPKSETKTTLKTAETESPKETKHSQAVKDLLGKAEITVLSRSAGKDESEQSETFKAWQDFQSAPKVRVNFKSNSEELERLINGKKSRRNRRGRYRDGEIHGKTGDAIRAIRIIRTART